ncbi:hypothetical protein NDA15_007921 [Ustilago hordei]|nr:hypothetical protein NDA15_007921 [Ustilago hordei]
MVCTSNKQHLLDNIETTIMHSLMVESKMQLDLMDVNATWHPNDDLEDSDDDMFNHAISFALIRTYDIISQSQYTVECLQLPQRKDPLINMLDRYAVINCKLFRGAVRMTPDAFQALTYRLSTTNAFRSISSFQCVQQQVAVGLYRLGQSGNGGGVCDVAFACGCSRGSVHVWTDRTIAGLYELNSEVVTFATEDERAKAKAWVADKSGVEEWSRGWLVVDGTHINLAWKPALNACEHYSYKGDYTFNIALVFLPHSLRIVESVVGHPGSSHDVRVWASGSGIVAKPCLHLDEGEFVWVDAGYGYSSYTVGPYSNTAAAKSRDLHYFNYSLSRIRVKAEHGIAYLKNRFQCLMGFRGNLYREEDHEKAAHTVQACIIAHTFASHYDQPDEVAEYLKASETLSEAEVLETMSGMEAYQQATEDARIQ